MEDDEALVKMIALEEIFAKPGKRHAPTLSNSLHFDQYQYERKKGRTRGEDLHLVLFWCIFLLILEKKIGGKGVRISKIITIGRRGGREIYRVVREKEKKGRKGGRGGKRD